jgi:DNA polymerase elongation subunit (family B)
MKMKREAIANKGIWTAKKRYILNVWDNEGVRYAEPKLKLQGIEAVRSSTPAACRKSIKEALQIVMDSPDDSGIQTYIKEFREKFLTLPFDDVAFPRSVRGLAKYKDYSLIYRKGTPIHVRGALIYNHMLNEKKLNNKYEMVGEGEKIKFCYLKMPNPARDNVISSPGVLPKEFELEAYIDRDKQFDKSFLEPIKTILDAIGWQTEKQSTLESFF